MKKFAMLALAMSLFLVACGEKKEEEKPAEQAAVEATATEAPATETTEAAAEAKTFSLKTEDGNFSFKESTSEIVAADGSTATLTDAEGKATELKNAETASGERYADEAGNEVAMKGAEGILTLGDLKEVPVTVEAK